MKTLTKEEKILRIKTLYSFDEICEIIGYFDESNPDLDYEALSHLEPQDFIDNILNYAIINGNFEEAINNNYRVAL